MSRGALRKRPATRERSMQPAKATPKKMENVSLDLMDLVLESSEIDAELLKLSIRKILRDRQLNNTNLPSIWATEDEFSGHECFKFKEFKEAIYVGYFNEHGERHGKGVMKYKNGRQYEGTWFDDLRDGKGFERYANTNTYYGGYKEGKAHGQGVYSWANGEVYDGEWDTGLKHGHGIWTGT